MPMRQFSRADRFGNRFNSWNTIVTLGQICGTEVWFHSRGPRLELRPCLPRIEGGHAGDIPAWALKVRGHVITDRLDDDREDDRNVGRCLAGSSYCGGPEDGYDINIESNNLGCKFGEPLERALRRPKLEVNVLPLHPSQFLKPLFEALDWRSVPGYDNTDVRDVILRHGKHLRKGGVRRQSIYHASSWLFASHLNLLPATLLEVKRPSQVAPVESGNGQKRTETLPWAATHG